MNYLYKIIIGFGIGLYIGFMLGKQCNKPNIDTVRPAESLSYFDTLAMLD